MALIRAEFFIHSDHRAQQIEHFSSVAFFRDVFVCFDFLKGKNQFLYKPFTYEFVSASEYEKYCGKIVGTMQIKRPRAFNLIKIPFGVFFFFGLCRSVSNQIRFILATFIILTTIFICETSLLDFSFVNSHYYRSLSHLQTFVIVNLNLSNANQIKSTRKQFNC